MDLEQLDSTDRHPHCLQKNNNLSLVGQETSYFILCASTRQNLYSGVCKQQRRRPACSSGQSGHQRSLINAFVIPFLKSIISKLATSKISIFLLVSVAEQTGLNLTLSEALMTGFVALRPI